MSEDSFVVYTLRESSQLCSKLSINQDISQYIHRPKYDRKINKGYIDDDTDHINRGISSGITIVE